MELGICMLEVTNDKEGLDETLSIFNSAYKKYEIQEAQSFIKALEKADPSIGFVVEKNDQGKRYVKPKPPGENSYRYGLEKKKEAAAEKNILEKSKILASQYACFKMAVDEGHPKAMYEVGLLELEQLNNAEEAKKWFKKAANAGVIEAKEKLKSLN
jgi:TPR repeat protein